MCVFKKNKLKDEDDVVNGIQKIPQSRKPEIYQYFYAYMLELDKGGFALVDVGSDDFFNKNWRFMYKKHKLIILTIYEWFRNDKVKFNKLFILLRELINNDEFVKMANEPGVRFLWIKSLHDSQMNSISYNNKSQKLIINISSKFAITHIPFNDEIELHFETVGFSEQHIPKLNEMISNNSAQLMGIIANIENGLLLIDIDYEIYINNPKEEGDFPRIFFKCDKFEIINA